MKFENAMKESFEDSYRPSELRNAVRSFAAGSKKIDPMNPDYKEKFKSVKYDYKGSKDDPEFWKYYKKHFMPKDTEADT